MTLRELTGEQLRERLDAGWRPWLVHVGTAEGYAEAHVPGALHLPDVDHLVPLLDTGHQVVLYGAEDGAEADHTRVSRWVDALPPRADHLLWHYAEGLAEWITAGAPTEP